VEVANGRQILRHGRLVYDLVLLSRSAQKLLVVKRLKSFLPCLVRLGSLVPRQCGWEAQLLVAHFTKTDFGSVII